MFVWPGAWPSLMVDSFCTHCSWGAPLRLTLACSWHRWWSISQHCSEIVPQKCLFNYLGIAIGKTLKGVLNLKCVHKLCLAWLRMRLNKHALKQQVGTSSTPPDLLLLSFVPTNTGISCFPWSYCPVIVYLLLCVKRAETLVWIESHLLLHMPLWIFLLVPSLAFLPIFCFFKNSVFRHPNYLVITLSLINISINHNL